MNKNIMTTFILTIFTVFNFALGNKLTFPFYIINKSKKSYTENKFKSFIEIPSLPVVSNNEDIMCLELCFGTPKECRYLSIHGQSFFLWLQDVKNQDKNVDVTKKFDPNKSTTSEINRTLIKLDYESEKSIEGYTVVDRIYVADKPIMRGRFMLATKSEKFEGNEGMIGLGYRGSKYEERFSFINQLFFEHLIFHRVFSQNFLTSDQGSITFGEIPEVAIKDYKHYGRCPALDKIVDGLHIKNRKWECEINGIYFGDTYNETLVKKLTNSRASFFSFRKRALVPLDIFNYLEEKYFAQPIKDGKCKRIKLKKYDMFGCKDKILDLPKFNIIYGDWVMSLSSDKLFRYRKKNEQYEFIFYHKDKFESFSLGRPIVRNFIMVYDYQNQEIGFYDEKNVIYINNEFETLPPNTYQNIPDANEPIDDNENNDPNKVPANIDKKNKKDLSVDEIVDIIKKSSGITKDTKTKEVKDAYLMQTLFYAFLVLVVVVLIIFLIYNYYKKMSKPKYMKSEYFLKKTNELTSEIK